MRLPSWRRIFKADFPSEFATLVENLGVTINSALEGIYNTLSRNVSLKDNVLCTVATVDLIVTATGAPSTTQSFKLDINASTILGVSVIQAFNLSDAKMLSSGVFLAYTQKDNQIIINQVTGLPTGSKYRLTVVAWGQ